jgi:hypothetical protein
MRCQGQALAIIGVQLLHPHHTARPHFDDAMAVPLMGLYEIAVPPWFLRSAGQGIAVKDAADA